jgi:hypothetical protein
MRPASSSVHVRVTALRGKNSSQRGLVWRVRGCWPQGSKARRHGAAFRRASIACFATLWAAIGVLLLMSPASFAAVPEEPETGRPEPVTNTTALLHGIVNPKSMALVSWFFEYNAGETCAGGGTTPVHAPEEVEAQSVEASIVGLQPATKYTVCLVIENGAEEITVGMPMSFTTSSVGPAIYEEEPSKVNATEATLGAEINANGVPTSYLVEYGTGEPNAKGPIFTLPAAEGSVRVSAHLIDLTPGSAYRFRFVATNRLGTTQGSETIFSTGIRAEGAMSALPDGRSYELVSPLAGDEEVYVPTGFVENFLGPQGDVQTQRPMRAAPDGDSVAFVDEPTGANEGTGNGGEGAGDEWLARRGTDGWTASDIQPPLTSRETEYESFSTDLAMGFIKTAARDRLTTEVPERCADVYARDDETGSYRAFFVSAQKEEFCGGQAEPVFAGAATNGSRLFFQTAAALTPGSMAAPGLGAGENLYDAIGGESKLVNVLPAVQGGTQVPDATYGGPAGSIQGIAFDFSNAISADGTRAFWTDLSTGTIYMRENGIRTIEISAGTSFAQYWTASRDGDYVFYTEDEKLFRFNVAKFDVSIESQPEVKALSESREELAGEGLFHEGAGIHGVLGTSEDGAWVYFVGGGVLAANKNGEGEAATAQSCREANSPGEEDLEENIGNLEGGGCNLYALHIGDVPKFIATLAPKDNDLPMGGNTGRAVGDWRPDLGSRVAEVAPDGSHLVFESRQRLTGYANGGSVGSEVSPAREGEVEIYVYDASDAQLFCASCDPTGVPPTGFADRHGAGTSLPPSLSNTFQRRWMNEAGTRVFFDTSEALVPQDTNGVQDVYEWEMDGTGSCSLARGCVYLLSGGQSPDNSFFIDTSASGGDAFLATREPLVSGAGSQKMELYDTHECTPAAPCQQVSSLACTGTGCQGVPPAPPVFATPASVTFSGVGNFALPVIPSPPKARTLTRAQQLARALRTCRHRPRKARASCEGRARKRYGAKTEAKTKRAGGNRRPKS